MLRKILKVFFIVLILFLFYIKSLSFLDPDFGWHLQTGRIILSFGVPKTDPFSYTMPNYPYVDHSWLTDLAIAKLYPLVGIAGLTMLFTIVTFASILIVFFIK